MFAEIDEEAQLYRSENEHFILQADTEPHGSETVVTENMLVVTEKTDIAESVKGDAETERLPRRKDYGFGTDRYNYNKVL